MEAPGTNKQKPTTEAPAPAPGGEASKLHLVDSQAKLGKALGVAKRTIIRWLKIEGNPGSKGGCYNVAEWKVWQAAHGKKSADKKSAAAGDKKTLTDLKNEGQAIDNEKEAFKLQVLKKQYIARAVVKQVITQFITAAKTRSISGVPRLVMLIRIAADNTAAIDIANSEMLEIWRELEKSEWKK